MIAKSRKSMLLPLAGPLTNFAQTNPERMVNFYAEKIWQVVVLRRTPGIKLFGELPGIGGTRGLLRFKGSEEDLFGVRGTKFSQWDPGSSAFIERGTLESNSGRVGMAFNSTQVIVVDDLAAYVYDIADTTSFAKIDGTGGNHGAFAFPGGGSVARYGSLRIFSIRPGTGLIYASAQDDARTWNPLSAIEAETFPDPLVGFEPVGPVSFAFGSDSFECYVDQGLQPFPLRRVQAGASVGMAAPASSSVYGGSAYWLGGSAEGQGIVYRTQGYEYQRISDHRVESIIQDMPDFSDAVGFIYQEDGHPFYVLNFGAGNRTLVYDISTSLWAERDLRNPVTGVHSRRPEICQAFFAGKNLVGDLRNGNVYHLSKDHLTDNGDPVIHERIFPCWPEDSYDFTSMPPFYAAMDVGQVAQGLDEPQAMLNWSDDRGRTYQGTERTRGLGRTGEYRKRPVWDGMGSSYGRAYRLRLQGPVDFIVREAGML